jgi:hypothetical protein
MADEPIITYSKRDTGIRCKNSGCSGSIMEALASAGEGEEKFEVDQLYCGTCKVMYFELPDQSPQASEESEPIV